MAPPAPPGMIGLQTTKSLITLTKGQRRLMPFWVPNNQTKKLDHFLGLIFETNQNDRIYISKIRVFGLFRAHFCPSAHCFLTIMDIKKRAPSNFAFQIFQGFIENNF